MFCIVTDLRENRVQSRGCQKTLSEDLFGSKQNNVGATSPNTAYTLRAYLTTLPFGIFPPMVTTSYVLGTIIDQYVYRGREEAKKEAKVEEEKEETEITGEKEQDEKTVSESEPVWWGDGKVVITREEFRDKSGSENTRFNSFDPMTVRIDYHDADRIFDPVFGIALYTAQGHYLYGTNTELKEAPVGRVEGEGYVDLGITKIPMLAGRFLLTMAAHTRSGKPYDWIDKQYSFEVVPALGCGDRGGTL